MIAQDETENGIFQQGQTRKIVDIEDQLKVIPKSPDLMVTEDVVREEEEEAVVVAEVAKEGQALMLDLESVVLSITLEVIKCK